ncbi:probable glycosyltransferase At5g03795 [Magnolia sinica]|uniref:probable glycosyltransferase At5g03795 n=1 Tax=Magnolia sinica TaxID=86752 RepID=UPI00265ADBF9|nr:probable glycosyltransferase At5g03795 [Magnolia sinica]
MSSSSFLLSLSSRPRLSNSFLSFSIVPTTLALITSLSILFYISLTSNLYPSPLLISPLEYFQFPPPTNSNLKSTLQTPSRINPSRTHEAGAPKVEQLSANGSVGAEDRRFDGKGGDINSNGDIVNSEVFHDKDLFLEDYKEMNRSLKIYVYPHRKDDPFAHALLPVDFEPGGNYASESYFKKVLMQSHFITKDPSEADLFFLPFSIARLRHDPRVDVGGIQDFIRMYISNISQNYPYWNRSGGADHFYVACHSAGRSAMEKAAEVKLNAIQVVCSSSYFLSGYVAHKDASLPQIWPRQGNPPEVASSKRKKLAFFAGSANSPVREKLLQAWKHDSQIFVHSGRLATSYSDELLHSKFCLHVKGFEVNTARIGDALYYGCVPVIIANHYDLPFADILNWKSFSLVVATLDIVLLKRILHGVSSDDYAMLQRNVLKVRKHFQWHLFPVDYDAFYMVMYELWLRRSAVRILISGPSDFDWPGRNISKCM